MYYQERMQKEENPNRALFSCFHYTSDSLYFENHCHSYYEIVYVSKNEVYIFLDGKRELCRAGDLVFVPLLVPHALYSRGGNSYSNLIIQISTNLFKNQVSGCNYVNRFDRGAAFGNQISCDVSRFPQIRKMLNEIIKLTDVKISSKRIDYILNRSEKSSTLASEWKIEGLLLQLLAQLIQENILAVSKGENDLIEADTLLKIQPVLRRMTSRPEVDLSLSEAAEMINMSYFNFSRTFSKLLGHSFVEHQKLIRIRTAEELLFETQKSITEIAELSGFGTLSYFNRVFKKINGCSPSNYRKRLSSSS